MLPRGFEILRQSLPSKQYLVSVSAPSASLANTTGSDGSSMIIVNGEVVAKSPQFSLRVVDVTIATVDIEQVRAVRSTPSRGIQAAKQEEFPRIDCGLKLGRDSNEIYISSLKIATPAALKILDPTEEIEVSCAVFL